MSIVREGFQVEFECGHMMVYDRGTDGNPEIGQLGRCHQCDPQREPNAGIDRVVRVLRQCWIETTATVHFEKPTAGVPADQPEERK